MLVQPDIVNSAEFPPDDCTRKRTKEFRYGAGSRPTSLATIDSDIKFYLSPLPGIFQNYTGQY